MPPLPPEDDTSSLERARERLYAPQADLSRKPPPLSAPGERSLKHAWENDPLKNAIPKTSHRHLRLASIFFGGAVVFFLVALGVAGYFFYYGGNSVSVNKISVDIQGPTTIAGGDTVPLSLTITNRNPVAIDNATIEIDFPDGTRNADNVLEAYPRYTENLGTLASGQTVTRSIKAVVFGGAGQAISLPVSFSYSTSGSNSVFVKKSVYDLAVSSTPLSLSVDTLSEVVSGKPMALTLTVRSNATVPIDNVVVSADYPFGFALATTSVPASDSGFELGTLSPGATKTITISGSLSGQDNEKRAFHFAVGTSNGPADSAIAVSYMTQDAQVTIAAPFITTTLSINGDSSGTATLSPGTRQSVTVSYANTLATNIANANISVALSGSAVDYNSIQTANGFYNSATHAVVFSHDTDPLLNSLAPGASGIGTFTFMTLAPSSLTRSPQVMFTISVSGTRTGESNVPEQVSASATKVVKVSTAASLTASSLRSSGPFTNSGPVPPRANQPTTYTIVWNVSDPGSAIAGAVVTATLPSYVSYTGESTGTGSVTYDPASRMVSWSAGDIAQGTTAQTAFQVSLTPSTSQKGTAPQLVGSAVLSAFDRFAGVQVTASANAVTTETPSDPGYNPTNATVQ